MENTKENEKFMIKQVIEKVIKLTKLIYLSLSQDNPK